MKFIKFLLVYPLLILLIFLMEPNPYLVRTTKPKTPPPETILVPPPVQTVSGSRTVGGTVHSVVRDGQNLDLRVWAKDGMYQIIITPETSVISNLPRQVHNVDSAYKWISDNSGGSVFIGICSGKAEGILLYPFREPEVGRTLVKPSQQDIEDRKTINGN